MQTAHNKSNDDDDDDDDSSGTVFEWTYQL